MRGGERSFHSASSQGLRLRLCFRVANTWRLIFSTFCEASKHTATTDGGSKKAYEHPKLQQRSKHRLCPSFLWVRIVSLFSRTFPTHRLTFQFFK
jgi:hypothetical protein